MINTHNLSSLLIHLGFIKDNERFSKHFAHGDFDLAVDLKAEKIIYPENKGFTVNEQQTCNFSKNENFVVLECVHRLFEKGYKPEHIELEPRWRLGHSSKSGRADILVRDHAGIPLLIIECKSAGAEFNKAWKDTLADGAQLFSYIEQEKATRFVCLYASDWNDKNQTIETYQRIISVKDNPTILEENPKALSFEKAGNNKQRFAVWHDTYKSEYTETGIFEDNIQAYQIGKSKYTLADDTKPIIALDIKGKYHEFRTILRKHNVSRRENAFEVLVNLFLCKIVDELEHSDDLRFYWKGIAYDNYYDLIDRLQALYKSGMERYLEQDIVYVSNEEIDEAFWAVKQRRNATKARIKEIFRELKFFKGLDFEFIKVHNKAQFDKNAKILIEIIQMWQGLRLTGSEQNQFLGDMFEYFLDNGVKQSEGQFFTPVPICKFIVSSLPFEQLISHHSAPIKVIDYACGSGHFLTEYAQQLPQLLHSKPDIKPDSYHKHTYGIEKEDRLAKVAKVATFMHGFKEVQILDADGLVPHEDIKSASFQALIANPPFAVEDFLLTIEPEDREKYELYDSVNDDGNKNIQCFFLERAEQLLAGGGVMGVIVPSSILSNTDGIHLKTREILLQNFDFIAITELGSGTFGKTGTNTVVLFLRRKAQKPEPAEHFHNRALDFFDNWAEESKNGGGEYGDVVMVTQYCAHIGVDYADYQSLLLGSPNEALLNSELFKDYRREFDKTEGKKLLDKPAFKKKAKEQQNIEVLATFTAYVRRIEQDKLYYYLLAVNNPTPVLIIKSPADNKAQKQFLGYDWSGAKGNEGIQYHGGDTVHDIITPLFDPKNRNNPEKISHLIHQNFIGQVSSPLPALQPFVSKANLTDMLDFSRTEFSKVISLNVKMTTEEMVSQWPVARLSDHVEIISGGTPKTDVSDYWDGNIPWLSVADFGKVDRFVYKTEKYITDLGLKSSNACYLDAGDIIISARGTVGATAQLAIPMTFNQSCYGLKAKNGLDKNYLFYILRREISQLKSNATGVTFGAIIKTTFDTIKIPLPPLDIQQKIVAECEAVDKAVEEAKRIVDAKNIEIDNIVINASATSRKLEDAAVKVSTTIDPQAHSGEVSYIGLENIESQTGKLVGEIQTEYQAIKSTKIVFQVNDVLYGKLRPNLNKVYLAKQNGICSTDILVFRFANANLAKYYSYFLRTATFNKEVLKTVKGQQLPRTSWEAIKVIKVPELSNKNLTTLVHEIEALENQIATAQAVIDAAPDQKQAILKTYL